MNTTLFLTEFLHLSFQSDIKSAFSIWLEYFEESREQRDFELCHILLRLLRQYELPLWERGKNYQCEGLLFLDQNLLPAAAHSLRKGLDLFRQSNQRQSEAQVLGNLGVFSRQQGDWDAAIDYYGQELAIYEDLHLYHSYAATVYNLALIYEKKGMLDEAEARLDLSMKLFEQVGNQQDRAKVLSALGTVYLNRPKREAALKVYQQAYQLFSQSGELYQASLSLNNIGTVFRQMGRWQDALDSYQASLVIKHELEDIRGVGTTLNNIGMVYYSIENHDQAEAFFEKSLIIFDEIRDEYSQGMALYNLCRIYYSTGELHLFSQVSNRALKIAESMHFVDIISDIERLQGQLCLQRREYQAGIAHLERGATLATEYGPELLEMVLTHTQQFLLTFTDDSTHWTPELLDPLVVFWGKWQLDEDLEKFFIRIKRDLQD